MSCGYRRWSCSCGGVAVNLHTLKRVIADLPPKMSGRSLSLRTSHHVLWLCRSEQSLRKHYGSRLGRASEQIGAGVEVWLTAQCGRILALEGSEVRLMPSVLRGAAAWQY